MLWPWQLEHSAFSGSASSFAQRGRWDFSPQGVRTKDEWVVLSAKPGTLVFEVGSLSLTQGLKGEKRLTNKNLFLASEACLHHILISKKWNVLYERIWEMGPKHRVVCDCLPAPTRDCTHTLACLLWGKDRVCDFYQSPKLPGPHSNTYVYTRVPRNTPKVDRYLLTL